MECAAGLAAVTGASAKGLFEYNRDNFLYDRWLRLRKELKVLDFRLTQASLWREDIRDLVSLTEYKMHAYLLVNVLMLECTVTLWCEGRLPHETPDWLMMGSSLSITGAFMFLLLSMWLAMHAAVAAQSYEARLLTQLVRLPIPSWQAVEACRTHASQFEGVEAKQMFRVPFVMGPQEQLTRSAQERRSGAGASEAPGPGAGAPRPVAADPWGFERRGDDIPELGCRTGSEVAKLRHVRLTHQAMTYWQSYDAFARISLSMGTNQLLLALTYYMLGYILVETGCRTAATYGVMLLVVLAEALTKLDMSLSVWQLRAIQFLLAYGPAMSCVAAYHWSLANFESVRLAEGLVITAFLAHGVLIGLIVVFCHVRPQSNGTFLPVAFRSVLYLDVFGWVKQSSQGDGTRSRRTQRSRASGASAFGDGGRPALDAVGMVGHRPLPRRPEDVAPRCRGEDVASMQDTPAEFFAAPGWMPGAEGGEQEDDCDPASIATGHENEMPRVLPWRLFCTLATSLGAAWVAAGFYHLLGASGTLDLDIPFEDGELGPARNLSSASGDLQIGELVSMSPMQRAEGRHRSRRKEQHKHFLAASLIRSSTSAERAASSTLRFSHTVRPVPVAVDWPPNVEPMGLSCDAGGASFAATDGVSLLVASLGGRPVSGSAEKPPPLQFEEAECAQLLGEGLQDTSVVCAEEAAGCSVLVLHRHGTRIAACAREGANRTADAGVDVSAAWLDSVRGGSKELAVALAAGPRCSGGCANASSRDCGLVGTSSGRVAQLKRHSKRAELVPASFLSESLFEQGALAAGELRHVGADFVGVLRREEGGLQSIDILSRTPGGASVGRLPIPSWVGATSSFCAGGGSIFLLGAGNEPKMWRVQLPGVLS